VLEAVARLFMISPRVHPASTHTRAPEFPRIPSREDSGARSITIVQIARLPVNCE
jgi:hypothetical protein